MNFPRGTGRSTAGRAGLLHQLHSARHDAMIMLNLFIGIIMNSLSEMHTEMEARCHARHEKEPGHATFMDELNTLEQ